ncbi:hypothetical protein WDW86_22495 [Bdellovibrionota bacterium FG-2]
MKFYVLVTCCVMSIVCANLVGCSSTVATPTPDPSASASPSPSASASPAAAATPGLKVTATVSNLSANALMLGSASTLRNPMRDTMNASSRTGETLVTPASYKLALVNFWLLKSDGTEINVINSDAANPTYTEERPLILDFSTEGASQELFSGTTFTAGTYTGYKMQFLYIEMNLPCAFHVPNPAWETEFTDATILDHSTTRNFRTYFNAVGKYWKRDFVVELVADSGEWYWPRRSVQDGAGTKNFFIPVATNDHPPGGPGFTSVIDLFSNEEFWGPDSGFSTNTDPIIVGTHSSVGGVNAVLPSSFTIPDALTEFFNIDIKIDVSNTMMFGETSTFAGDVTPFPSVLDLGPAYAAGGAGFYGDQGLHPLMPAFTVTVTNGATDAKATADKAFQIPEACVTGNWLEPVLCQTNYCPTHATDKFCVDYAAVKSNTP